MFNDAIILTEEARLYRHFATFWVAAAIGLAAPFAATACVVSSPLPPAILAQDVEREGRAWAEAPLVYLAEITGNSQDYAAFELTPRRILKGDVQAPVLNVPALPSRGICLRYHGLSVADGAYIGDEFVVYALSLPVSPDDLLVVSARMIGDPSTRAAMRSRRSR